jgi:hypothetical protein
VAEISFLFDCGEIDEALAVFARWHGKVDQLPARVVAEFMRLLAVDPGQLIEHVDDGPVHVLALKPEVRALVATLRAHEKGAGDEPAPIFSF